MKTKALVCVPVFLVVVLAGVFSLADDKENFGFYVPKRNEEIYGTWVNKNYDGISKDQKIVYYYWGYGEFYRKVTNENPAEKFSFTITDKWFDSEGNIWYKVYDIADNDYSVYFELCKISNNMTVLETAYNVGNYPTNADLNEDNYRYRIRFRQ